MTETRKRLPRSLLPHPHWGVGNELTPEQKKENLEFRFWHYVDKTPGQGPQGECWEWRGAARTGGYGELGVHVGTRFAAIGAHVISYQLAHGSVPEGKCVCHSCDNPPCVRPDHLWAGTHKQNSYDAQVKGRKPYKPERHNRPRSHRVTLKRRQINILKKARIRRGLSIYDMGFMLQWDYTRYHRFETGGPSCRHEQLNFLLKFLEIDETKFNLRPSQIREYGSPDSKTGRKSAPKQPVRTFAKFAHQVSKPHVIWERFNPSTEHYRADLLINALKTRHIQFLKMCKESGVSYHAFRAVLKGEASHGVLKEKYLPMVIEYAGLSLGQVLPNTLERAA